MGLLSQQRGALLAHCVIERAGIHELIEEWAADGPSGSRLQGQHPREHAGDRISKGFMGDHTG